MRHRSITSIAAASLMTVFCLALASFVSRPVVAQNGAPTRKPACIGCSVDGKTTPRMRDGHPDLNGFWNNPPEQSGHLAARTPDGTVLFDFSGNQLNEEGVPISSIKGARSGLAGRNQSQPSYKPEYAAKVDAIDKTSYGVATGLDPMYDCKKFGVPRGSFGTMQIVQTPQVIAILYDQEGNPPATRLIYMDGRPHPEDLDTSYMGDSIGHWEGDTLVVDVTGLSDETWLGGGFGGPRNGLIHSDKEHVIERWTRKADDLGYEATVEDPVMFTKPWVVTPRHIKHAGIDDRYLEETCTINDKEHIIVPTKDDQFECNYCASTTKASTETSIKKKNTQ